MFKNSFNSKSQKIKNITPMKRKLSNFSKPLTLFSNVNTVLPLAFCAFASVLLLLLMSLSCQKPINKIKPNVTVKTFYGITEKIGEPFGIAVRNDEIYVSDGETGKILKISKNGNTSIFSDKFDTPSQIAFDKNGDLIVADSGTHTIKKIKPTGEIETIAGVENQSGFADGDAQSALFYAPIGVAVSEEKIFVADTYNDKIRVIENGNVSTLAGSSKGFSDGAGASAKFDTLCGIAVTADGKIIVADSNNRRLRVVEPDGRTWTLAGNGTANLIDGSLSDAVFVQPTALTIDKTGTIYIADGNAIRVIDNRIIPIVKTISNDIRGFADGNLKDSRFNRPSGLALDEKGNLFVADSENQSVRVFTGEEIGKTITPEEIEMMRVSAEDFRKLADPRWSYDPPGRKREIAGTLGEVRGEIKEGSDQVWFHNGLDIVGGYGETARFIRSEKVLRPIAAENFASLRELVRLPTLGYIHLRLGRDRDDKLFDDKRFLFSKDENEKLVGVRVPRGIKFQAGEAIGTLNAMNHVHLIAGRSGAEMNALDALILPDISDKIAPVIEKVSLYNENWVDFENQNKTSRITLSGKTRIVVKAYDRMDGNAERRRLGVFSIGYQLLKDDKTPLTDRQWTIRFEKVLPEPEAVKLVYALGSKSGATGETIFNYIATNKVHGSVANEDFFDTAGFEKGNYVLRVFAADYFGNTASKDLEISINK